MEPIGTLKVKSTKLTKEAPFYFSALEYDFSKRQRSSFFLYRVFNLKAEPKLFIANGAYDEFCNMRPTQVQGLVLSKSHQSYCFKCRSSHKGALQRISELNTSFKAAPGCGKHPEHVATNSDDDRIWSINNFSSFVIVTFSIAFSRSIQMTARYCSAVFCDLSKSLIFEYFFCFKRRPTLVTTFVSLPS